MGVRLIPNFQIENGVQLKLTIEEIISLGKENLDFVKKLALTTKIRVSKDNFLGLNGVAKTLSATRGI